MQYAARIQASLEILDQIDTTPKPADALVSAYFRARKFIGSKDRAAISRLFYAVLRHTGRVTWWLSQVECENTPRTRMIVFLALYDPTYLDKIAPTTKVKSVTSEIISALLDTFDGHRYAPDRLNTAEVKLLDRLKGRTPIHPAMPESVAVECPDWAEASLRTRFGSRYRDEMNAMLAPAPLDLRVNPLKSTRDAVYHQLKREGYAVSLCPYSPDGLRLAERPSLSALTLLKDGTVEIQDEGSQLVARLVQARPGERVVDFCAGAGGKTLALAAQMNNKGRIVACDILARRLERSTERFRRAGFHNIEIHPLTHENDPWVKRHKESYDRVLVDAPCSGSGTWRRNPDQRWRSLGPGLETLLPLQASILSSAARLVKKGGRLVYATCSLLPEENDKQVERFLADHADFSLVPLSTLTDIPPELSASSDCLSLSPAAHHTDGFFGAVFVRNQNENLSL